MVLLNSPDLPLVYIFWNTQVRVYNCRILPLPKRSIETRLIKIGAYHLSANDRTGSHPSTLVNTHIEHQLYFSLCFTVLPISSSLLVQPPSETIYIVIVRRQREDSSSVQAFLSLIASVFFIVVTVSLNFAEISMFWQKVWMSLLYIKSLTERVHCWQLPTFHVFGK
jgi:hypothetical protein